jgi:hypothetical protein
VWNLIVMMTVFVRGLHMLTEREGNRLFDALNILSTSRQKRFLPLGPVGQLPSCQGRASSGLLAGPGV